MYGYTEAEMNRLEELWGLHNPAIPAAQPGSQGLASRAESEKSRRRRSKRLLNRRQRVTFVVQQERREGQWQ